MVNIDEYKVTVPSFPFQTMPEHQSVPELSAFLTGQAADMKMSKRSLGVHVCESRRFGQSVRWGCERSLRTFGHPVRHRTSRLRL